MEEVVIDKNAFAASLKNQGGRLCAGAVQMISSGHIPGVLSLAGLQGRAKTYASQYARRRDAIEAAIASTTGGRVRAEHVLIDRKSGARTVRRWCRVWASDGRRTRVRLASDER